ncbi:MAG TPA: hypothetical protein VK456_17690 [Xanthobacteraceae bacterium]|nr:hypothetical protein [Xanthobacteraceae bacterium]
MSNGIAGFGLLGASPFEWTDEEKKIIAWNNVLPIPGKTYKVDCDGLYIVWEEYGKRSDYGWQIDHAVPEVFGGLSTITNLRARHWRGNSRAGGYAGALAKFLGQ